MCFDKLIYLASPYTHPISAIEKFRYYAVCIAAAQLTERGHLVYSPIAETIGLKEHGGFRGSTWQDWGERDTAFVRKCEELWVFMIPGYKESIGVRGEIEEAIKNEIPVYGISQDLQLLFAYRDGSFWNPGTLLDPCPPAQT